jgi:hypothetical protein
MSGGLSVANFIGLLPVNTRMIGTLVPGIVLEESHDDLLEITDHPVEIGANITDHAFKQPPTCTISCQWSNTQAGIGDFSESYVSTIYAELIALQLSCTLLTVVTGKRTYNNMLIARVHTSTDKNSEYSLPVQIDCRTILTAQVTTTSVPALASNQTAPSQTAPVIQGGAVSPTNADPSTVSNLSNAGVPVNTSILASAL